MLSADPLYDNQMLPINPTTPPTFLLNVAPNRLLNTPANFDIVFTLNATNSVRPSVSNKSLYGSSAAVTVFITSRIFRLIRSACVPRSAKSFKKSYSGISMSRGPP